MKYDELFRNVDLISFDYFSFCGFANALIFKELTEDDITSVQSYVQDDLLEILDLALVEIDSNYADYNREYKVAFFGEFTSKPKEFIFLPDERETIMNMVRHVKDVVDQPTENAGLGHFADYRKVYTSDGASNLNLMETVFGLVFGENMQMNNAIDVTPKFESSTHQLLSTFADLADQNVSRTKPGYRFTEDVKLFATYIRILGGPLLYETIHKNLPLAFPSLDTTNRQIRNVESAMTDGSFRIEGLLKYLNERNLPLAVALSEDATAIEGRIQYDSRTNQITGFALPLDSKTGMPIPMSFPARNCEEIVKHFSGNSSVANYVNVIMAKPVANYPAFCILLYASDGKYTAEDISHRWAFMTNKLREVGIKVLTISSDSDAKNNSAMRKMSLLGMESNIFPDDKWFSSGLDEFSEGPFFIQDNPHILTKLRNIFLRTFKHPEKLKFANFYIRTSHLVFLLNHVGKDNLPFRASDLNSTDKQNVDSARRICDPQVIMLLKEHLEASSVGTVTFLQIVRDITDAFTDRHLAPLERVAKMWYSLFLIRIWRQYIVSQRHLSVTKNFLTTNCYSCVELNAHGLIHLMIHLKNNNLDKWFIPFIFDSQACESFFRQVRSLTSVYHRAANCSVKEIIGRINRIELLNDIANRIDLKFPRMADRGDFPDSVVFELPTKEQIHEKISECQEAALDYAFEIGLLDDDTDEPILCQVQPLLPNPKNLNVDRNPQEVNQDTFERTMNQLKGAKLNNFAKKINDNDISESSLYVKVHNDGSRRKVFKKPTVCWYLRREPYKLSSDRIQRVKAPKETKVQASSSVTTKKKNKKNNRFRNHTLYKK